jgi:hypothetical protein
VMTYHGLPNWTPASAGEAGGVLQRSRLVLGCTGAVAKDIRDANAGHADFATMMRTAGAEALIANAYGAKRR